MDALVENVPAPQADTDYIEYFCGEDSESDEKVARRDTLYGLTASLLVLLQIVAIDLYQIMDIQRRMSSICAERFQDITKSRK